MSNRPGFMGYPRADGRVGTRNYVLVVPTVICSSVVCERITAIDPNRIVALPHQAGCGQLGPDMRLTHETLAAYCRHPNVGAVLAVFQFAPAAWFQRMQTIESYDEDRSAKGRLFFWQLSWVVAFKHPITGAGFN